MIQVEGLCLDLGSFSLTDINLSVEEGEYFVVLGPTGSGKTILLECLAGIRRPHRGKIFIEQEEVTRLAAEERKVGYVPQDYMIFPFLDVAKNIAFGLSKLPGVEAKTRVEELAHLLGISHLLHRHPSTLSGGEKQRVALARALSIRPRTLLLDEPLAALDPGLRHNLWWELKRIQRSARVTTVHVTHDFEEALVLADTVAVLNEGRIVQTDIPERVFRKPRSRFVAEFLEVENIFRGKVVEREHSLARIALEGKVDVWASTHLDGEVFISVRPEDIVLTTNRGNSPQSENTFWGEISGILNRGALFQIIIDIGIPFTCLVTRQTYIDLKLNIGSVVGISFRGEEVHVF